MLIKRPGYFGRQKANKIAKLNKEYGQGNWTLVWVFDNLELEFKDACIQFYEESYIKWFKENLKELDFICQYKECIDNDITNIQSGTDYSIQESWATHIQDIAIRNVLKYFNRKFENKNNEILVIRSRDSIGFKYGPGNIPFYDPSKIYKPSLCPKWANSGSVEDFWQSNKFIKVKNNAQNLVYNNLCNNLEF